MQKNTGRRDAALIIALVLIAAVLAVVFSKFNAQGGEVNIEVGGKLFKTLPLNEDTVFELAGNTIAINGKSVYMQNANCPDKTCVAVGAIFDGSKSIVCLPNKVTVWIGKASSNYDAISG